MVAVYFAEAFKVLGNANIVEAARFFKKHNTAEFPNKSVAEAVQDLTETKEADGCSSVYVKDLKSRLGRFAEAFPNTKISLVTAADIEKFLREMKVTEKTADGRVRHRPASPKTRNHVRGAIGTLFYFAETRGYIPKGLVDIESIALVKQKGGDIEIFRPEELERVFEHAKDDLIPFLAISAFAGLRHAEVQRLDWAEVRFEDGFIEVKASKAKTASRRLVPITDNLKLWLEPRKKKDGPVCRYANMSKQLMWLAKDVHAAWQKEKEPGKFEWKHNALRHSFISYRVADIQNVAQVALEAGNSPRMVFSNYRKLVRPVDAKKWFAITPESVKAAAEARKAQQQGSALEQATPEAVPTNIVPLPTVAVA